jgi:hypothetical protein
MIFRKPAGSGESIPSRSGCWCNCRCSSCSAPGSWPRRSCTPPASQVCPAGRGCRTPAVAGVGLAPPLLLSDWVLVQMPASHVCPSAQGLPHSPQLSLSDWVLVQVLSQQLFGGGQQAPLQQVCPSAQGLPQAPQLLLSDWVLLQVPLQQVCPAEQQMPPQQVCPSAQGLPQAPQLL